MFEQNFRNSSKKYFLARTVSKLAHFTPFASINVPSKRELLIMSATFLPLSCSSIHKSSLVERLAILFNYSILSLIANYFEQWRPMAVTVGEARSPECAAP